MHDRALEMRREMTPAERRFWEAARGNRLGVHFRRQQVVGGFIVDFYCRELNLVVEIDGEIHDHQLASDREREEKLHGQGIRIMRFANEHIVDHLPNVLAAIRAATPPPKGEAPRSKLKVTPLPKGEGLGEGS